MSLREEIKAIHDQFSGTGDDELLMWDEIINKTLDAVVEALKEDSNHVDITTSYGEGICDGIGIDAVDVINKLRGEVI